MCFIRMYYSFSNFFEVLKVIFLVLFGFIIKYKKIEYGYLILKVCVVFVLYCWNVMGVEYKKC